MACAEKKIAKRIFLSPPWMGGCERERVDEAFVSNYIAPCGPMVDRFEREFAQRVGLPYACALSSCTAALDLLFHELKVTRGDTVFCSDLTFVASIAPAVQRGATPVFIDSDEVSWTINPDLLEEALADAAKAGRLPKAVVAVDLYGQCCDYDRVEAACGRYGVPLIVDAAEALGAEYRKKEEVGWRKEKFVNPEEKNWKTGRSAGHAGWAGVYSFNGNKIITTSGGGMLASRDARLVERARALSQQAREGVPWYEHRELGYNYRMSNIVAAIGVGQLSYLDAIIEKKRAIFDGYCQRLEGVADATFMPEAAYGRCTRWLTVVQLEIGNWKLGAGGGTAGEPEKRVMRVIEALEEENIEARPVWKPMHLQPVFEGAKTYGGGVAARLFRHGVCLPSGTGLSESELDRVVCCVARALEKS